jgi:hypothetical protein
LKNGAQSITLMPNRQHVAWVARILPKQWRWL